MWALGIMQCCQWIITFQTFKHFKAFLIVLSLLLFIGESAVETCSTGLTTPGTIVPENDIKIKHGDPLEMFCILYENNTYGRNASDLFFERDSKVVSPEYTSIINRTTLRLYIPKPPPSASSYLCKLRMSSKGNKKEPDVAVCLNTVYVGLPPQDVINFTCISNNWENLTCSWTVPKNYVPTTYQVYCYLGVGKLRSRCPNNTDEKFQYCFWNKETSPHYRSVKKEYMFSIDASNDFGNTTFEHSINHWAHVVPAKPKDLSVIQTTSYSALLSWAVTHPMDNFLPGLSVKIEYRSQYDPKTVWQLADTTNFKVSKHAHYNLTGLKYANTVYEARVYMKSAIAVDDAYWSKPATVGIKTKATIPGASPETDIGSFEISSRVLGREVFVYWQHINNFLKNGNDFKYVITDVRENGIQKQLFPVEMQNAYAKFKGLSKSSSYSFTIVSANAVGHSLESSKVFIPSEDEIPPQPISFANTAFQNGTFELSWKPPANISGIKDYTIFWCEDERDRPYQCKGFLDWIHVPKNENVKLLHVPNNNNTYQFAISVNSEKASSGMVWASCTVIHNQSIRKMKEVKIKSVNATFLELEWILDCSEHVGTVKGYRIYYCPTPEMKTIECKGEEMNETVDDGPWAQGNYVVRNLKPYTTYRVSVAVISSKLVEGPRSDYKFVTTTESAPQPVENLSVSKITNVSVLVSWAPPAIQNGIIKRYEISYNGHSKTVYPPANETTLDGLTPFTNYSVSVTACTVNCSFVVSVPVQTRIGSPGRMEAPKVSITNTSQARVSWEPPLLPGGQLDKYTLRLASENDASPPSYMDTTDTEVEVQISCANKGWGRKYLFAVRASNRDGAAWYAGPWSADGEGSCVTTEMSEALIVFISLCGVMATGAACVGAFFAARRVWGHYNEMRHVKVTLPPGLASVNVYCPTSYSY
ncbi:cytokine receptor [Bacillus rossius redtenbacheri]|uniref:cytokine receptor n=1 Tax=Bacillus rossius redtenbacheri TaxID=93214 RepID=UPI002FDD43A8